MKKNILFLFVAVIVFVAGESASSDVAQRLNYQGRLTDSDGIPLADNTYSMVFSIYDAVSGGSLVWGGELHGSVTVEDGLFSVLLGETNSLAAVNWNQDLWIEVSVGATTFTPRQQLTAVAYALTVPEGSISAAHLAVNVVSSVDGVTNDGGNIDLFAGSGITITPDDGADRITIAADASTIDHGALTGLGDDDHPQYFRLADNETVTGIPAFNGGNVSNPPFTVDTDYLVTNLNADLLDGHDTAYFVADGCADCLNATEIEDIYVLNTSDTMSGSLGVGTSLTVGTTLGVTGSATISGGAVTMNNATSNKITFGDVSAGNPSVANAWREQYYTGYGRGIEGNTLWDTSNQYFKWYDNSDYTNAKMTLDGNTGNLTLTGTVQGTSLISTVTTGTAPLTVSSTTNVTNLNADYLDGYHFSDLENRYVNVPGDTMTGWLNYSGTSGISMNDKPVYLRGTDGSDTNHGVLYNATVNGPEYRGYAGFTWKTGTTGATERMKLLTTALYSYLPTFVGSSDANKMIKFTDAWSSYPDSSVTGSEISNDTGTYKTLMIIGNKSYNSAFRRVSVWDRLEINGPVVSSQAFVSRGIQSKLGPGTGADNQWHQVDCDAGYAITNFTVYVTGSYMDGNMTIMCENLGNLMTSTCAWTTPTTNADNTYHYGSCPANTLARGIKAYANSQLDYGLSLNCCNTTSGSYTQFSNWIAQGSTNKGLDDNYMGIQCPSGTFLTDIAIWASSYLDGSMLIMCGAPAP